MPCKEESIYKKKFEQKNRDVYVGSGALGWVCLKYFVCMISLTRLGIEPLRSRWRCSS